MTTIFQVTLVVALTWIAIVNGRHLRKEKELVKKELDKIKEEKLLLKEEKHKLRHEKHKRDSYEMAAPEKPPAPVMENIEGEKSLNAPFISPSPGLFRIPLEAGVIARPMNTDISGAIKEEQPLAQFYGELPSKGEYIVIPEEFLITPVPVVPQPSPPAVSAPPPVSPVPPVPVQRPFYIGPSQAIYQVRPPAPVPAPVPPPAPAPAVPPAAPPAPAEPVEPPPMKPSRYAVYLGDMFLKLMTQLLSRARLTLNRLTGPPPVTPEVANNGK